MINPTVGDPLTNLTLAAITVAAMVAIAHARGRAPLWPAVLLALVAQFLQLLR